MRSPIEVVNMLGMKNTDHHQSPSEPVVYAVLDFETTGLNPKLGDRAIEIGISLCSGGKEIDTFSSLINPGMRIDPFITHLTGITNSMVATAPPARVVMQEALDFVGDAHLVAHNASFDKKFWRHELSHDLNVEDGREFLCTLMLSRRVFQSFGSHRLGEIASVLGITMTQSHRALDDAQATAKILFTIIDHVSSACFDKYVDADFLRRYQKRSRASLPDLSTKRHVALAIKQAQQLASSGS